MTRSEIVKAIHKQKGNLLIKDIERVIDVLTEKISNSLADGHRIELRGFGIFAPKKLAAKVAPNPKDGAKMVLPERLSVKFKAGKLLAEKINR